MFVIVIYIHRVRLATLRLFPTLLIKLKKKKKKPHTPRRYYRFVLLLSTKRLRAKFHLLLPGLRRMGLGRQGIGSKHSELQLPFYLPLFHPLSSPAQEILSFKDN